MLLHKSSTKQNIYIKGIISNGVQKYMHVRITYYITDILLINFIYI